MKILRNQLVNARDKYGTNTPKGHRCSNLIANLDALERYVRPDWATCEGQTLQGKMRWQMARLEAAEVGVDSPF